MQFNHTTLKIFLWPVILFAVMSSPIHVLGAPKIACSHPCYDNWTPLKRRFLDSDEIEAQYILCNSFRHDHQRLLQFISDISRQRKTPTSICELTKKSAIVQLFYHGWLHYQQQIKTS